MVHSAAKRTGKYRKPRGDDPPLGFLYSSYYRAWILMNSALSLEYMIFWLEYRLK